MDVDALFLRGKEAADRGNYDYAITIFLDVLRIAPTHRSSRIALRGCEMEKFRALGSPVKAKAQAIFKGFGALLTMRLSSKKPDKVIPAAEKYLVNDPTNIWVLLTMADAYANLGHLEAATDTLEFARQRAPENVKVLRHLADAHIQQNQYDKAIRCYQEILAIKPEDREAGERIRSVSAESHLKRSKLEEAQSYRDSLRDEKAASALEQEGRVARTSEESNKEIAQVRAAVEVAPENAEAHQRLGDALYRHERYQEAEASYRKAFEIGKKYPAREKMGNARLRLLEHLEATAKQEAEDSPEPIAKTAAREARKRRIDFAIKEFDFRRKQHPTDMKLAYQLGMYYFELGGDEATQSAIQQFQQSVNNPGLRVRSLYMLGRCFAADPKTLDMAREQYNKALDAVEDHATDVAKTIMYEIGAVAEKDNNLPEALNWYKKIFSVDAAFRDVAQKIQKLG